MEKYQTCPQPSVYDLECLRLEMVTVCVGFDDLLDYTLGHNHPHFDTVIVVTTADDRKTHAVCQKHGCLVVQTDLFQKNGRQFNKGAAINAGFNYYQYHGWRMHLDADMIVPDNFKRILFNHTHLDHQCIYGADRVDVYANELKDFAAKRHQDPQHRHRQLLLSPPRGIGARYVDHLDGYLPIGCFQLWNARCQQPYPFSLGTAAHDDIMFSALWPRSQRHHLPTVVCRHVCTAQGQPWGHNWEGRRQPRLNNASPELE